MSSIMILPDLFVITYTELGERLVQVNMVKHGILLKMVKQNGGGRLLAEV